jgi:hypothetical protein
LQVGGESLRKSSKARLLEGYGLLPADFRSTGPGDFITRAGSTVISSIREKLWREIYNLDEAKSS